MAPASAFVASPGGPSHASAPVAQMVVALLKPALKMNLSHMWWFGVWSEENVFFLRRPFLHLPLKGTCYCTFQTDAVKKRNTSRPTISALLGIN